MEGIVKEIPVPDESQKNVLILGEANYGIDFQKGYSLSEIRPLTRKEFLEIFKYINDPCEKDYNNIIKKFLNTYVESDLVVPLIMQTYDIKNVDLFLESKVYLLQKDEFYVALPKNIAQYKGRVEISKSNLANRIRNTTIPETFSHDLRFGATFDIVYSALRRNSIN